MTNGLEPEPRRVGRHAHKVNIAVVRCRGKHLLQLLGRHECREGTPSHEIITK